MADLRPEDLHAAVAEGAITAAQARRLEEIAATREAASEGDGDSEPVTVIRGFNEVFVIVGIAALFAGLYMLWPEAAPRRITDDASLYAHHVASASHQGVRLVMAVLLAGYFYVRRNMMGPGVVLTALIGWSAYSLGASLAWLAHPTAFATLDLGIRLGGPAAPAPVDPNVLHPVWTQFAGAVLATAATFAFYLWSRIPFGLYAVAAALFFTALFGVGVVHPASYEDLTGHGLDRLVDLSTGGPLAPIVLILGFAAFVLALRFDLRDPLRIGRDSAKGFWLHLFAGPAVVNVCAFTLLSVGGASGVVGMVLLFALVILTTLVIDRRTFLMSAFGYMIALALSAVGTEAVGVGVVLVVLSVLLLVLGAFWQPIRAALMQALPDFPGKSRLPPYATA